MSDPINATAIRLCVDGDLIQLRVEDTAQAFDVGSLQSILEALRHEPPTAYELEVAIELIEETVMPVVRLLPSPCVLETGVEEIIQVADLVGLKVADAVDVSAVELSTEQVEGIFNRLADVAQGAPVAQSGVPVHRRFAAVLLLVRELLHHGGFGFVPVVPELGGSSAS